MPEFRRKKVEGGCYFFTVALQDRRSTLLVAQVDALRDAVRAARARHPFHIDAWVVLPDHMHCVWTLPPSDSDFPRRWQMIKAGFSRAVPRPVDQRASLVRKRETGVWQRRYWEHTIRDDRDYAAHLDYVHFNPVNHGLVTHPDAWPHSMRGVGRVSAGLVGRGSRHHGGRGATVRGDACWWAEAHPTSMARV